MNLRPLSWILLTAAMTGCARRAALVIPASPASAGLQSPYIDLQAGWRLRVITPLTKSGRYLVGMSEETQQNGTVTLTLSDDFLGYATSFYNVLRTGRSGVRLQFASGEQTRNGVTAALTRPQPDLSDLPRGAKYIRLVYLRRVSRSDHNMAVIAAAREQALAQVTAEVLADSRACRDRDNAFCSWVPAGIAVRPERRNVTDTSGWEPVN